MSEYLLELLRGAVCPALLAAREMVALDGPDSADCEALLNLYLYDVRETPEICPGRTLPLLGEAREAPLAVTACYMAYCSRHAQNPAGALTEQRILGRVLQTVRGAAMVEPAAIHEMAGPEDAAVSLSFSLLDSGQKRDLWNALSQPLRPAVYFQAGPLLIRGAAAKVNRVRKLEVKGT